MSWDGEGGHFEGQPGWCKDQAVNVLVGACVGQGAHRMVYRLKHRDDLVMKVEKDMAFANAREWMVWDEVQWDPKSAPWLVPCFDIDHRCGVLVQGYARDLNDEEWAAVGDVPDWLGDTKRSNWGWYEGRARMRDYAITRFVTNALNRRVRMVGKDGE